MKKWLSLLGRSSKIIIGCYFHAKQQKFKFFIRQLCHHSPSSHSTRLARPASGECFWRFCHQHYAQSLVSVTTSDMLWHSVTGSISWDIEFVLSTSPIQYMFCNEFNDIKWMNPLREFSMELLYLLFQKCEISLFPLPNVADWRDWTITFQPQHLWTRCAGGFYLEFKFQSIYGSRNFICDPCAEITSKIDTLTQLRGSN